MIEAITISRMLGNHLVHHYLLASFCYYHLNESPMTDEAFDFLCSRLQRELPDATTSHAALINPDDLDAGTCLIPRDKFPSIVVMTAFEYLSKCANNQIQKELEPHLAVAVVPAKRVSRRAPTIIEVPTVKRISRRK